jgi:hypothetical protein
VNEIAKAFYGILMINPQDLQFRKVAMSTQAIPLIEVQGTHREVGQQIGEHFREQIGASLGKMRDDSRPGVSWEDMLHQGGLYLAHSNEIYPRYIEELQGIAEGAQVPRSISPCEELWEASPERPASARGCTVWGVALPLVLRRSAIPMT